jgi:cyclohexa-1,5-dienecarbonyl-CoA hydratase
MNGFRFIRYLEDYDVARLELARPPLNILTVEMMREMSAALERVAGRAGIKALVLSGEGKAFSAGVAVEEHMGGRLKEMLEAFHDVFRRLHALDCLTLAAVRGAALGGGAELAAFCDVVVAGDDATFGQPEIKLGVFPPIAAVHYPRRLGVGRTLSLLLSGDVIGAVEAERMGLVDQVMPAGRLAEAVDSRLARVRGRSAAVLRLTKRAVLESLGVPFEAALSTVEDLYRYELMATEDAAEGLRAFLEKRPPIWKDR